MRRARSPILSLLVASLLVAGPAAAKEIKAVKVCGVNACRNLDRTSFPVFEEGGQPIDPPRSAAGWYRARLTVAHARPHESFWVVLVPSARMVRSARTPDGSYQWMPISAAAARAQQRAVRGLQAYPASMLHLGGRPEPARAQVSEIVLPPASTDDGGRVPWAATIGLLGVAGAVGGGWFRRRRRRNGA